MEIISIIVPSVTGNRTPRDTLSYIRYLLFWICNFYDLFSTGNCLGPVHSKFLNVYLGVVFMIPGRLSRWREFTPVPSCGSVLVYMIPPQNVMPARVTSVWVHRGFGTGWRISLRYEILQRYHVKAKLPLVSVWNRSAVRLELVAHAFMSFHAFDMKWPGHHLNAIRNREVIRMKLEFSHVNSLLVICFP